MEPFRLLEASDMDPRSPQGMPAFLRYEGRHGPAFTAFVEEDLATQAWGPDVPDARLDFGPSGRRDGQRHTSFVSPVALEVGTVSGEVVQPHWALFNRRRRGVVVHLGPRSYLYRVAGFSSSLLERDDRTPLVRFGGLRSGHLIAETVDAVEVALALVLHYGVPHGTIAAQG